MTRRCPDDDPLDPDVLYEPAPERGITRRVAELSPVENGGLELLRPLNLPVAAQSAFALLNLPPSLLARLIRPIRRAQAKADAKAAAEVMAAIRRVVAEYSGMQRDVMEALLSIIGMALDLDKRVKTHHLDVELEAVMKRNAINEARAAGQQRAQIRQRTTRALSGAPPAAGATATGWADTDPISNRARITTLKAIPSIDADDIADPYVAYAAHAYATRLRAGSDDEEARASAFNDVREMLAENSLTAKDAAGYTKQLKALRAEMKKQQGAQSALGGIAAAIKGGGL